RRGLTAGLCVIALSAPGVRAAESTVATDTPEATVASLQRGLLAASQAHPGANVADRYRALEPLVEQTHDLPYIAEFALRKQWPSLAEADRQRFVAAFEKLSVMTYASRFKNVTANTFKSAGQPTIESGRAHVLTAIARQSQPDVSLDYMLEQNGGAWRIINIIADGVSDLALKRAEYQRILGSGSIDDLIKELEAQTARLEHP
ncbi:MAG TPA: ABC transporter substrate-binding protein, partial [Gammaproteobacteria bacterium]|nr:ABC transporter substrate-binding protein [Gammaproteobacteria bacterium]